MKFTLVDRVLSQTSDRIVALKQVSAAEEYLQDHFPTFPVLPGVMMLEAMTQAARLLLGPQSTTPMVLGQVRALKYGQFVKPGDALRITITLHKSNSDGSVDFKGICHLISPDSAADAEPPVACSGRLTLRPARLGADAPESGPGVATPPAPA